jgi:hypothetical protein
MTTATRNMIAIGALAIGAAFIAAPAHAETGSYELHAVLKSQPYDDYVIDFTMTKIDCGDALYSIANGLATFSIGDDRLYGSRDVKILSCLDANHVDNGVED